MASSGSIPSVTTGTDVDEYNSAQEEVDSVSCVQNEAEGNKNENEAEDEKDGLATGGNEENETDDEADVNELTVFIPQIPQPQVAYRPQSAAVKTIKRRLSRAQFFEREQSQLRKILCGVVILLIIFGLGALMIILALWFNIDDLFIVGGIFVLGGTLFTIGFIIVRCTAVLPYDKKDIESYANDLSPTTIQKDASSPNFDLF